MRRDVCIHQLPDVTHEELGGFRIAAHTSTGQDLINAVGSLDPAALVINLDAENAFNLLVAVREIKPHLPVVGATGRSELTHVIAAQRAGCAQITAQPIDAKDLIAALCQALKVPDGDGDGKNFSVFSATGGAGATTLACYLAIELARITEKQTALLDLDLEFGGVARTLDISTQHTLADLATASSLDGDLMRSAAVELEPGVHAFVRAPTLEEACSIEQDALCSVIQSATEIYPYVVFDLPRKLDHVTSYAVERCDKLIVLLEVTLPGIENAKRLIDALSREIMTRDRIAVVVNRYRKGIHACTVEMAEKYLQHPVLSVVPNDYHSVRKAIDTGKRLSIRNPVRREIAKLATRLLGQEEEPERVTWFAKLGAGR